MIQLGEHPQRQQRCIMGHDDDYEWYSLPAIIESILLVVLFCVQQLGMLMMNK